MILQNGEVIERDVPLTQPSSGNNETYWKNKNLNVNKQKKVISHLISSKGTPTSRRVYNVDEAPYDQNWLILPIYFIPFICYKLLSSPLAGIIAQISCAWYIKLDAEKLKAGSNQYATTFGILSAKDWGWLLAFFWGFIAPIYSWKRRQIFLDNNVNIGRSPDSFKPTSKINAMGWFIAEIFLFFIIVCIYIGGQVTGSMGI